MDVHGSDQRNEGLAETPVSEMTGINIVDHSQVVNQVKLLVYGANLTLDLAQGMRTQLIQSLTQHAHFAGGWKHGSIQQPDEGALPGTTWTN
jgi:hypothetical protein